MNSIVSPELAESLYETTRGRLLEHGTWAGDAYSYNFATPGISEVRLSDYSSIFSGTELILPADREVTYKRFLQLGTAVLTVHPSTTESAYTLFRPSDLNPNTWMPEMLQKNGTIDLSDSSRRILYSTHLIETPDELEILQVALSRQD